MFIPKKALNPPDILTIKLSKEEDIPFFMDIPYSNDYFLVDTLVGKRNYKAIKVHEISESKNLELIFKGKCRNASTPAFVPRFDMLCKVFPYGSFAPAELDLGSVTINADYKLNDCLSQLGNIERSGWVINQRLLGILKQFNIGEYKTYKIRVIYKGKSYDNYVYFHFLNYADNYVDFSKSKFFCYGDEDLNKTMKQVDIRQEDQLLSKSEILQKSTDGEVNIFPKELFLTENNLDLFKFDEYYIHGYFISKRLADKLIAEKVTGFEIFQTTKVKKIGEIE